MTATDALETYFERHRVPSIGAAETSSVAVVDAASRDEDYSLRQMVQRRIELRMMGYDVSSSGSERAMPRRAGLNDNLTTVDGSPSGRPLAFAGPDDGIVESEEDDDFFEAEEGDVESPSGTGGTAAMGVKVPVTSRSRAADAILKRLVAEIQANDDEDGSEEDASWTPDGTRWDENPEFMRAAGMSAASVREKYPDMFTSERSFTGDS